MKTTDSVMRDFDEKFIILPNPKYGRPYLWKDSSYILNGENDGQHAQIINIKAFLSHSLASARREWVESVRNKKLLSIAKYGNMPAPHDPTYKEAYNQAIDDVLDLLTGDNPESECKVCHRTSDVVDMSKCPFCEHDQELIKEGRAMSDRDTRRGE